MGLASCQPATSAQSATSYQPNSSYSDGARCDDYDDAVRNLEGGIWLSFSGEASRCMSTADVLSTTAGAVASVVHVSDPANAAATKTEVSLSQVNSTRRNSTHHSSTLSSQLNPLLSRWTSQRGDCRCYDLTCRVLLSTLSDCSSTSKSPVRQPARRPVRTALARATCRKRPPTRSSRAQMASLAAPTDRMARTRYASPSITTLMPAKPP